MSSSNVNLDYMCFICRQPHKNLKTLHTHHIFAHSPQELSFAIIALHGWKFMNEETKVFEGGANLVNISDVCEQITGTQSESVTQIIDQSLACTTTLATGALSQNFSQKMCCYPNEKSSQVSAVSLNVNDISDESINIKLSDSHSSAELVNSCAPITEKKLETSIDNVQVQLIRDREVFSSDDLSGSETDTDIEVNGNGRLFDSDYDIKIDVFEECEGLEIEDSNRGFSPNKAENVNNDIYLQKRENFYENTSVFPLIGPVAKLVMGGTETTKETNNCVEIKTVSTVSYNYPLSDKKASPQETTHLALSEKERTNKAVINEGAIENVGTTACKSVRGESCRRQSFSPLVCELNCSPHSVDHGNENKSLHDILVPLVAMANSESKETSYISSALPVQLTAQNELVDIDEKPAYVIDTLSNIEFIEKNNTNNHLDSMNNITGNIKVETIDHTDLSLYNYQTTQIPVKTISSLYRSATTCVVRTGGFFKAKIEPGPLKDSTISKVIERRFFCESCGKGYKKKSHLERHLRAHTGERPFQCSYCTKRFAVRSILKQHVRIHTGEKPYCCSVCFQRFPQKSGLMTHMMLHTGKPFKCDFCEKSFVSNHKLLQHLKSHESQNIYSCSECKTKFFTEGALREHSKIHKETRVSQSVS